MPTAMKIKVAPKQHNAEIAARLRAMRTAYGMTLRAFAKHLGMDEGRYGQYERGANGVGVPLMTALREKTGVSADWLLFGDRRALDVDLYERIIAANPGKVDLIARGATKPSLPLTAHSVAKEDDLARTIRVAVREALAGI